MSDKRKVEWFVPGLEWQECEFEQLKEGDMFRLTEPTGEPVVWKGETIFHAMGDAYQNEDDIWAIETATEKEYWEEKEKEHDTV